MCIEEASLCLCRQNDVVIATTLAPSALSARHWY